VYYYQIVLRDDLRFMYGIYHPFVRNPRSSSKLPLVNIEIPHKCIIAVIADDDVSEVMMVYKCQKVFHNWAEKFSDSTFRYLMSQCTTVPIGVKHYE